MNITENDVIKFVIEHGDEYDLTMKQVEFVGMPTVLDWANAQCNPRSSKFVGTHAELRGYPEGTPAEAVLADFFAETFGHLFDTVFAA